MIREFIRRVSRSETTREAWPAFSSRQRSPKRPPRLTETTTLPNPRENCHLSQRNAAERSLRSPHTGKSALAFQTTLRDPPHHADATPYSRPVFRLVVFLPGATRRRSCGSHRKNGVFCWSFLVDFRSVPANSFGSGVFRSPEKSPATGGLTA